MQNLNIKIQINGSFLKTTIQLFSFIVVIRLAFCGNVYSFKDRSKLFQLKNFHPEQPSVANLSGDVYSI